jgi:hypothetical protein
MTIQFARQFPFGLCKVGHRRTFSGFFPWVNDCLHAEMFVGYAMFSSGASRDFRVCHGIEKKCCPVFRIQGLQRPWDQAGAGEVFLGKQEATVVP